MKHLIIIGARGAGRETYETALYTRAYDNKEYDIKGFLDDKADALDATPGYPPILGPVETYYPQEDDVFICALGDPEWRKHYVEIIIGKGGQFITLIDKTARICTNAKIGMGCVIRRMVELSNDTTVGDFSYLQPFTDIGHDAIIGRYCHLNTNSFMGGYSEIEDMVTLQTHAVLLPHKKVGKCATIGAGTVAIRNVKAGTTVFGVPAMRLGK